MNVKGLKLNKFLVEKILESYDSISLSNLYGIDSFNSFSWIGFSKEEFKDLLSLLSHLFSCGLFSNISNHFPLIINYSTDITEMDIVTVLKDASTPVFIDIESKNGDNVDELINKINQQIDKRITDYLPQLIKNNKYIVAGFVNNGFVQAKYYNGDSVTEISTNSDLISLINGLSEYSGCEDFLVQSSNLASIVKVCEEIRNGSFKYFEETNKIYRTITSKIELEDAYVIYGNAGTGKSILALRLLFEFSNTKILLVNSKLYYSLNMQGLYNSGKATYSTSSFLNNIDENTISIVDECQRVPVEVMAEIIKKSKYTFLFGDNKQAFNKKCTLKSARDLSNYLRDEYGFIVSNRVIKKAKRYSDETDKAISSLTSFSNDVKNLKLPSDYQINIYYDEQAFVDVYESTTGIKKMYCPLNDSLKQVRIGDEVFEKVNYNDDGFSVWAGGSQYYGTVYHALSFDIDHCFVYLKNINMITFGKSKVLFPSNHVGDVSFDDIQRYANELNVLFTRGRKSLSICVNDIETYLHFNYLINKMK